MYTQSPERVCHPRPQSDLDKLNEELSRAVWEVKQPAADQFLEALRQLAE
jgi:hypothetical protein